MVFGVHEEDYAGDFGEVVAPKATSWGCVSGRGVEVAVGCTLLMASKIEGCKPIVANSEFF